MLGWSKNYDIIEANLCILAVLIKNILKVIKKIWNRIRSTQYSTIPAGVVVVILIFSLVAFWKITPAALFVYTF